MKATWPIAVCYLLVFLLLDWVSYIRPFQGLNITPWNPQPALAIALLSWNGRLLWLVWLSVVLAEMVVRGWPFDWFVTLAAAASLSFSYAVIARGLRLRLDRDLALATRRDLAWFCALVVGGSLLSGAAYVATFAVGGVRFGGSVGEAVARYWIGDAVGLVVMLPTLMVLVDPRRRAALAAALRGLDLWLITALVAVLLVVVFGREDRDHFKFFYLLFVPVVWASARFGLAGAVWTASVAQVGLIVAVQSVANPDLIVFELQVLMAAVTMTGLMLGVTVDERERAASELRSSLHFAAAGQMTAALAHELSQPLTAISTYAQASQLLAASADLPEADRRARLSEISGRLAADALRAGEVVKRLRDFFRSGSNQLQSTAVAQILGEAVDSCRSRADALRVPILVDGGEDLPPVLIDPVQIGVVLRNLLANAIDAVAPLGEAGQVSLRATAGRTALVIEVQDNGPGIDRARLASLFEPGPSDKPGAMGIGLSISKAIVESHDGSLSAKSGPGGHFCLTLPIDHPASARHAS